VRVKLLTECMQFPLRAPV